MPQPTPYENILKASDLPEDLKEHLPKKWELLGDVLLMKIPIELEDRKEEVAKTYAQELSAKTVLRDLGIGGRLREPTVELLWGRETETVHVENAVKFKLDAARLMFSSGNVDERIRMAAVSDRNEVVVDMFAGIGFFSIPIAVHSKPKKVYACELNPVAYKYLCDNIVLNQVEFRVEPFKGDNRFFPHANIADRIVMGYLDDTYLYVPKALSILKRKGGVLHYHEKCPDELIPERPLKRLKNEVAREGRRMELLETRTVKSYAPGVSHVVLDARVW